MLLRFVLLCPYFTQIEPRVQDKQEWKWQEPKTDPLEELRKEKNYYFVGRIGKLVGFNNPPVFPIINEHVFFDFGPKEKGE